MSRRPVPPFGKALTKLRSTGARPPVCVHTGPDGWESAKAWIDSGDDCFSHLWMPIYMAPSDLDWRVCAGLEVAILYHPIDDDVPWETVDGLAIIIVKAGATKVCILDYFFQMKTFLPLEATA